ncbi:MAG: hypothetical protein KDB39_09270 [Austwickia sp.]|nr:hypothetical protein [Austwickia sp.]
MTDASTGDHAERPPRPDPQVRLDREAGLLAAALAQALRARSAGGAAQGTSEAASASASAAAADPAGEANHSAQAAPAPESARSPEAGRPESAALSELLTGAGLVARGGMELLGGVMARLMEVSGEPGPRSAADAEAAPDPEELGAARMARYRRTVRRAIPVVDDPGRMDLA